MFGQQFLVENVVGAGGTRHHPGRSPTPDGYTLVLGHVGAHAAAVALYPNLSYRPEIDFEPIGLVAEQPMLLVTRKDLPPNNLKEFVAYARANESKLTWPMQAWARFRIPAVCCSTRQSESSRLWCRLLARDLPAGQVDFVCDPILGPLPHVRAGTIKAHAIATTKRHPALPDVPTAAEGGLPEFFAAPFYAVFAPKGTPQPVRDKLVDALNKGLDDEAARNRLIDLGAEIADKERRGPKALAALVNSEIARLSPILQAPAAR